MELDIQMTKDGSLAVIHDETIDRVCDGSGCVADFTMKELKKFRCSRLHPEFADARIPELGEVLSLIKPSKLTVNIELKTGIVRYKGIEEAAVKLVKEMGMEDRVIYSSFHHPSLLKVKRLDRMPKRDSCIRMAGSMWLPTGRSWEWMRSIRHSTTCVPGSFSRRRRRRNCRSTCGL